MGFLSLAVLASCTKSVNEPQAAGQTAEELTFVSQKNPGQEIVPNEIIVRFKKGQLQRAKDEVLSRVKGSVKEKIVTLTMQRLGDNEGITLVNTELDVYEAIGQLKGNPAIEYAEPNFVYTYGATSTDTYYTGGNLWGMYGDATSPANQYGSQAGEAWAVGSTGSKSVVVGIIDEGVQVSHPDLDANIWVNPFDVRDGVDNDGNGYVDDVNGWDFANNDNNVYDGGTRGSLDDHGTHVAGTIGAESNGTGVVGVNWEVTLISCKFLGRNGGTTANAVKAVDYLTDLKARHGVNVVASNNSWGGGGFSQSLYDAIARANAKEILFIAAAGNGGSDGVGDNIDSSPSYPASYNNANIISVASITSSGAKSSFSNYGATSVDLGAPGSGIYSTTAYNTYSSYSGTSMATPHVTGGVALYAASHPGSTAAQIKSAVLGSAVPTASLSGRCVTGGRLNVSGF